MAQKSLRFTPMHLAGVLYLIAGLVLAVYHGLEQFGMVPQFSWVSWSHIHFVTIGAVTQLLFAMLPQLSAQKLKQATPPRWYYLLNLVGLNAAFVLLWYGRGWGNMWAFDLGVYTAFALVLGLLVVLGRMALRSDDAWNVTTGLYLVGVFVFLWGISYAYGLFGHVWSVPGGWLGLREAHVHANGWGFLGLVVIGTMYELFPRIVGADLYSERLRNYSAWLFVLGIFPLITGPWLGMGRSITASGLVVFATGFAMYVYNLVQTYRASDRPGIGLSTLVAQFWILGPAGFAPFVLFGVEWVKPAFIEDGALHFFFMGWALPVVFAGLVLYFRNLPCMREGTLGIADRVDEADILPDGAVPDVFSRAKIWTWNVAILVVGVGFFYQDQSWSQYLFGAGYTVLALLWGYYLVAAFRVRLAVKNETTESTAAGGQ